jgi:pimeloyl-ACP methyl ester carboxylesterase
MTASAALEPRAHIERAGHGPAILLLHGWGTSAQLWRPVMGPLSASFSVLAPDLPGFGQTANPPAAWGVEDYARWVLALLDLHGLDRVHLVGHSNGGRVAIKLAAWWPERVEKLVLTSSAGIRPARSAAYRLRVASFKALRSLAGADIVPAGARRWAAARVAAGGSEDYRSATGTMRPTFVRIVNEDLRPDLRRIAAPTLLVWGDRDDATPLSDGQEMERLVADAGLVVFPGATHYAYLEQPARFCRVLEAFFGERPA